MTYKIESGIEPPPERLDLTELVETMRALQVGQSFILKKSVRYSVNQYAQRLGIRCRTRAVDQEHIRVWRTK
jgi:hypothetical protein